MTDHIDAAARATVHLSPAELQRRERVAADVALQADRSRIVAALDAMLPLAYRDDVRLVVYGVGVVIASPLPDHDRA